MFEGRVDSIHIASAEGEPTRPVGEIAAVAGRGLEGDRYFEMAGKFSQKHDPGNQVTLIEAEAIEAAARDHGVELGMGDSRRNIVTRDVPLNHLVGRNFKVGEVVLRGIRLCDPCGYLENLTRPGTKKSLENRGGLNAEIVSGGTIRSGDQITGPDA
jgi:MOSC domain-containing protein YiiM